MKTIVDLSESQGRIYDVQTVVNSDYGKREIDGFSVKSMSGHRVYLTAWGLSPSGDGTRIRLFSFAKQAKIGDGVVMIKVGRQSFVIGSVVQK